GRAGWINVAFKELYALRWVLDRTEHQPPDYRTAHETRSRFATELAGLEEQVAEVSRKIEHYAKRVKARPYVERRNKVEARLKELPAVESFPEGGVERLDILLKQRQSLVHERSRIEIEAETGRLRRLQMHVNPDECAWRAQVIESLRTLAPRVDAARRVYTADVERRDAVAEEKRALVQSLGNLLPPSWPAFGLFIGLIWIGVLGLALAEHHYVGAILG